MAIAREITPDSTESLCEMCGYRLNGLPDEANCPECGSPVANSRTMSLRFVPAWERADPRAGARFKAFVHTSTRVLFTPAQFFRTLRTRTESARSRRFANLHSMLASVLGSWAAVAHGNWQGWRISLLLLPLIILIVWLSLGRITSLAARLTTWEANYRGYRLPQAVVRRALDYHAVHYVPVAAGAFALVLAGTIFSDLTSMAAPMVSPTTYLYALCGYVVGSAIYLFTTYWTAMRNIMYANV